MIDKQRTCSIFFLRPLEESLSFWGFLEVDGAARDLEVLLRREACARVIEASIWCVKDVPPGRDTLALHRAEWNGAEQGGAECNKEQYSVTRREERVRKGEARKGKSE